MRSSRRQWRRVANASSSNRARTPPVVRSARSKSSPRRGRPRREPSSNNEVAKRVARRGARSRRVDVGIGPSTGAEGQRQHHAGVRRLVAERRWIVRAGLRLHEPRMGRRHVDSAGSRQHDGSRWGSGTADELFPPPNRIVVQVHWPKDFRPKENGWTVTNKGTTEKA